MTFVPPVEGFGRAAPVEEEAGFAASLKTRIERHLDSLEAGPAEISPPPLPRDMERLVMELGTVPQSVTWGTVDKIAGSAHGPAGDSRAAQLSAWVLSHGCIGAEGEEDDDEQGGLARVHVEV